MAKGRSSTTKYPLFLLKELEASHSVTLPFRGLGVGRGGEVGGKAFLMFSLLHFFYQNIHFQNVFLLWATVELDVEYKDRQENIMTLKTRNQGQGETKGKKKVPQIRLGILA